MPAYSYLKSDIINTSENDSTEFANQIPNFIDKAERRLTYYLDDYGMDEYMNVSVSSGNAALVTLNDRTRIVRNINYVVSNGTTVTNLLPRTIEYAKDYWPVSASVGTPRYYSRTNNTNIKIVPTPTSTITAEIQTQSRPLALSSATGTSVTTSNYFSEYCYDALFQACMLEATIFMKDWNTVQFWKTTYDESINGLRNQARRTRQDDMAVAASPAGGADTIIQGAS
jgi:hypothetical protein